MFKFKLRHFILSLLLLPVLFISPMYAAKFEVGDYTLDKQAIVEDDLYVSGDSVNIHGVVDGDLIVFGENISVDGTVTGDMYLLGSTLSTSGNIYGNSILGGSSVDISGTYGGNIYLGAMITNINGSISRDILAIAGTFNLSGSVLDDVRVAAGQIVSDASVGGDFLVGTENYSIDENSVYGDLIVGTNQLISPHRQQPVKLSTSDFWGYNIGLSIISFLGMYIVGTILILLAPVKTLQIEKKIISSWTELLKSYAIGVVILLGLPLPIFLLVLTLVGIPLTLLIMGGILFLSLFGIIWTESAIGQKILLLSKQKDNGRFISLLIGRLISVTVRLIPVINFIYSFSLIAVTTGAVVRTKYDAYATSRKVTKKK